jgi:hypothetical protein
MSLCTPRVRTCTLLGWIGVLIVVLLSEKTNVSKKQREIAELEGEVKLAELLKRQAALLDQ